MKKKDNLSIYDKMLLDIVSRPTSLLGTVIKHRKVKVPNYIEITVPVFNRHYDNEYGDYEGLLITTKRIRLFRWGYKYELQPVFKRLTGTIKFARYSKLKVDKPLKVKDIRKAVNKLNRKLDRTAKRP